jgi:type III protein arginine methyltransferase
MNNIILKYIEQIHELYLPQRLFIFSLSHQKHKAYQQIIYKTIMSHKEVVTLHIGLGSILSAMIAATSGAKKSIICETSKYLASIYSEIIKENQFLEKISIIPKRITELKSIQDFEQRPNILIFDCIDSSLIGQRIIPLIQYIQNDLSLSDIKIIPEKATLYAVPLELRTNNVCGFDLSPFNRYRWNTDFEEIDLVDETFKYLTDPFKCFEFDFEKLSTDESFSINIKINESGILNSIQLLSGLTFI